MDKEGGFPEWLIEKKKEEALERECGDCRRLDHHRLLGRRREAGKRGAGACSPLRRLGRARRRSASTIKPSTLSTRPSLRNCRLRPKRVRVFMPKSVEKEGGFPRWLLDKKLEEAAAELPDGYSLVGKVGGE